MAECVYLNFSQANNSCVNISNKHRNGRNINAERRYYNIYLLYVNNTFCPFEIIINIRNIIGILNETGKRTPHSKLVNNLTVSDISDVLTALVTEISI